MDKNIIIAIDLGTTGFKACAYEVGSSLRLVHAVRDISKLSTDGKDQVEQDPEAWWQTTTAGVRTLLAEGGIDPNRVAALSFTGQLQVLVLVDKDGNHLRPAISHLDSRARQEWLDGVKKGFRISGYRASRLLPGLYLNSGFPASAKDVLWKYEWVRNHEPEVFARVHKWLGAKDYLVLRSTGAFVTTGDEAHLSFLTDVRRARSVWSPLLCRISKVNMDHLPTIIESTDRAGELLPEAAEALGLPEGVPVYGGGGDIAMVTVGAGNVNEGDAHVHIGTTGWIVRTIGKKIVDIPRKMAGITGGRKGLYNFIGDQSSAGKCLEWAKDHLVLDGIGAYTEKTGVHEHPETDYEDIFQYLDEIIGDTEAGSNGVIFTPWLSGSRSPFEDSSARGVFIGLGLTTGKRHLIRAVLEGMLLHLTWLLEGVHATAPVGSSIRFVGGGALSKSAGQILADLTGRRVEVPVAPQFAGTLGTAAVAAIGAGLLPGFEALNSAIAIERTYEPKEKERAFYLDLLKVFKRLYPNNKNLFKKLQAIEVPIHHEENAAKPQ